MSDSYAVSERLDFTPCLDPKKRDTARMCNVLVRRIRSPYHEANLGSMDNNGALLGHPNTFSSPTSTLAAITPRVAKHGQSATKAHTIPRIISPTLSSISRESSPAAVQYPAR